MPNIDPNARLSFLIFSYTYIIMISAKIRGVQLLYQFRPIVFMIDIYARE